jgi:SEC-C motif domain protein
VKRARAATTQACPCGRLGPTREPLDFAACCGRYIGDFTHTPAPDAESLMRSRYSAFVQCADSYLRDTWHASTRPDAVEADVDTRWLGLEVLAARSLGADSAEVEFVARYRPARPGPAVRIHERSRFVREAGRWYYVDGDQF